MKEVLVYCEGPTEETFIKRVLKDYLAQYGVPGNPYTKVKYVEQAIAKDLAQENLIPNLMLHEFEALLFSEPAKFQYCGLRPSAIRELQEIREHAETPEHINNDPNTAPSKRILRIYPQYSKVSDGFQIAKDIGLDTMLSECKHFAQWVEKLKALGDN